MILSPNELIIDSFAGGGGASQGIYMATGRHPDVAINHDPEAVAMHAKNHPTTKHYCKSIYQVDPDDIMREEKRPVGLAWFSPDCTHHSKARGGKPKEKHIRDLAWVVVHFAERAVFQGKRPRIIVIENVEEFKEWGPLLEDGQPDQLQKGFEFQRWVKALRKLGYVVEWREMRACDYGAPTIRKRLFIVARCDGLPIAWPEPTHGKELIPYRTAAECIDWSIPCPSIFERKRALADNTLRRIAKGIKRYVIDAAKPFIVNMAHRGKIEDLDKPISIIATEKGGCRALAVPYIARVAHGEVDKNGKKRGKGQHAIEEPLPTITASQEYALVTPFITKFRTGSVGSRLNDPLHTITSGGELERPAGGSHAMGLVAPILVGAGGPEYTGKPRAVDQPIHTMTSENHSALVTAFLAQHNSDRTHVKAGRSAEEPLSTITASGTQQNVVTAHMAQHNGQSVGQEIENPQTAVCGKAKHSVVTSHLVKFKGTCKDGQPVDEPMATVQAQGLHIGEVRAFMVKYYGNEQDGVDIQDPMHTVTANDRFGLVTVYIKGVPYIIVDIGMRMLSPRELYNAQGFPPTYIIDFAYNGKPLTKTAQVRMCGNSVSPHPACAIIVAQLSGQSREAVA